MEKVWLKRYPPGVAHEVRYDEFESVRDLFEASVKKFGDRPAYHNMGKSITFSDLDRMSRAFGAWLQANGFGKGTRVAIMMPNVLQYPVALFGTHRAGCIVVNVNPLYTARELEHQLKDSGAEVIVILENFAATLSQVLARTTVKKIVVASLGDLLGFKGLIVNFVVRHVKKMVPAFELPEALRFNDVIADGARHELKPVAVGTRRHRVPSVHRRHHRRRQGRDAGPPQHSREPRDGPRPGSCCRSSARAPDHHHGAAPLSHLLADRELPDLHEGSADATS